MHRNKPDPRPVLELASRLYVHYKFKTREEFDFELAVDHDGYAREVLAKVRTIAEPQLQEIADRFEQVRFPGKPARSGAAKDPPRDVPRRG